MKSLAARSLRSSVRIPNRMKRWKAILFQSEVEFRVTWEQVSLNKQCNDGNSRSSVSVLRRRDKSSPDRINSWMLDACCPERCAQSLKRITIPVARPGVGSPRIDPDEYLIHDPGKRRARAARHVASNCARFFSSSESGFREKFATRIVIRYLSACLVTPGLYRVTGRFQGNFLLRGIWEVVARSAISCDQIIYLFYRYEVVEFIIFFSFVI